jgi:hypothetical protein
MSAPRKPSRPVTRGRCIVCDASFRASRSDARYCSGACRQRAQRARCETDLGAQIEEARKTYWALVRRQAEATGRPVSQILTAQSQLVDEQGNVYMGGNGPLGGFGEGRQLVGRVKNPRPGWSCWGLEAAGPPFAPPPTDTELRKKWRKRSRANGGAP